MSRVSSLLCIAVALIANTSPRADEHPNVLFFAIDDLRPELGCYGHAMVKSPNIDRLASQGLLFERAYCQQAVCAPSRISLLTGLRPDSTGIYDLSHPLRQTRPELLSMPHHFKDNGYETVSLVKIYHHTGDDNLIGWTGNAWRPEGEWKGRGYLDPKSFDRIQSREQTRGCTGVGPAYESPDVEDGDYPDGKIPDQCEGTSVVPLLEDPIRSWKEAAFSQYPRGKVMGYSIRCGKWRYTEWIDCKTGRVAAKELYDHSAGPAANRNLATDPAFGDTVKRLAALLDGGQGWKSMRERLATHVPHPLKQVLPGSLMPQRGSIFA